MNTRHYVTVGGFVSAKHTTTRSATTKCTKWKIIKRFESRGKKKDTHRDQSQ